MIVQSTLWYHVVAKSEQSYISALHTFLPWEGREGCDVTRFTVFHEGKLLNVIVLKLLKYYHISLSAVPYLQSTIYVSELPKTNKFYLSCTVIFKYMLVTILTSPVATVSLQLSVCKFQSILRRISLINSTYSPTINRGQAS